MFRLFSESMLANVIAFEEGRRTTERTHTSRGTRWWVHHEQGVVFRTPVDVQLPEAHTRELVESYSTLVGEYSKDELDRDYINSVKLRNYVSLKVSMIRSALRKQGRNRT